MERHGGTLRLPVALKGTDMAKRTTSTSGRSRATKAASEKAEARKAAETTAKAGAAKAAPAPDTEGAGEAGKPAEAPTAAPAVQAQEQPGGSDGATPASSGSPTPEGGATAASPVQTPESVAAAVAAITGPEDANSTSPSGERTPEPFGDVLKVTGPTRGRRRANRDFSREPVFIPVEELSPEDIAALDGDPALTVEVIAAT